MKLKTSSTLTAILCGAIIAGVVGLGHAQKAKSDPSGTWYWMNAGRNGNPGRSNILILRFEGSTLNGRLETPGRDGATNVTEITDGKYTGETVSFTVTRGADDKKFSREFSGTVTDDMIKGTVSGERDGEKQSRKWEAKRVAGTVVENK